MHREERGLPPVPLDLVHLIREQAAQQILALQEGQTSKALHERQLASARQAWVYSSSEETCWSCLRRKPQHCLPCQHWMCQTCVRIFGYLRTGDPWLFHVDECILCGALTDDMRIRVKPPTATARVLSIDGGGTRGRAPLEFLQVLEHAVGLPYPVQHHFDVVYGTSSGCAHSTTKPVEEPC